MSKKLLRKKLALMLATLKKKRPYYCEVEYLQNKARADYINTGIYYDWSQNTNIDTVFSVPNLQVRYVIAGSFNGIGLNLEVTTDGKCRMYGNNGTPDVSTTNTIQANEKVKIIFKRNYPDTEMTVITPRWTETVSSNVPQTGISATALYLFKDTRSTFGLPMIYKFYIKMGDLEKDFIPVLDWNYNPCMYEKNALELYYDANTLDMYGFIAGREIHPVEYLESTGTQYININWIPNANGRVELQGAYTEVGSSYYSTAYYLFAQHGGTNARFNIGQYSSSLTTFSFDVTSANRMANYPLDTNKHIFGINAQTKQTFIDDNVYENPSVADFGSTTYPSYIFARNISNVASAFSKAKIYYCKIWDNNTLVRNFIPAIDENGVGFMFDRVTHTCFLNQGTGSFKYPAREVEYLESTGTQYIDTGIKPTDTYGYRIRNTYTTGQGEQCAIGCMDSGNRFVGVCTSGAQNQLSGAWGSFVGFLPTYSWDTGDILDVEVNYKNSRKMIVGGTELKDISDVHISGTISNTLYIGARHYGGTITIMKGKIYDVEITNNTDIVADFIPVFYNGEAGLWDKANNTFYSNAGTGSFVGGKVKESEWGK